jgi:hypothetical protein
MFQSFAWTWEWWLIAAVVVLVLLAIPRTRFFGTLLAILVVYLGCVWNLWFWASVLFWIFWILALIAGLVYPVVVATTSVSWWEVRHTILSGRVAITFRNLAGLIVLCMIIVSLVASVIHVDWGRLFTGGIERPQAGPTASSTTSVPSQMPSGSPTTTPKPSPTMACPQTWEVKYADHGSNRWFAEGIASIQNAKTNAQAAAAAQDWVHRVESDPINLSGAISYFLNKDVPQAELVDGKCASETAKSFATQLELKLSTAKSITAGNAPSNGTNSGVDNGRVVSATSSGVTGNTKAIKVDLGNGKVIWIMARCGNAVTTGKAPVPPGKTERQPKPPSHPPTSTPKCKPGEHVSPKDHHTCIVPKDASKNVLRNPNVPDQVKGTGKTQVGQDPGAATKPTDGGTGCGGPCPSDSSTSSSSSTSTPSMTSATEPAVTPDPISSSPTVSGTVGPHGP